MGNLQFFIDDDIDDLIKESILPLAFYNSVHYTHYIMQENRIVYCGTVDGVKRFMTHNEGKYCDDIPFGKRREAI